MGDGKADGEEMKLGSEVKFPHVKNAISEFLGSEVKI